MGPANIKDIRALHVYGKGENRERESREMPRGQRGESAPGLSLSAVAVIRTERPRRTGALSSPARDLSLLGIAPGALLYSLYLCIIRARGADRQRAGCGMWDVARTRVSIMAKILGLTGQIRPEIIHQPDRPDVGQVFAPSE